jgi:hypothetical protein
MGCVVASFCRKGRDAQDCQLQDCGFWWWMYLAISFAEDQTGEDPSGCCSGWIANDLLLDNDKGQWQATKSEPQ